MDLSIRTFLVVDGEIKKVGLDRFSRFGRQGAPEFAGQKIPYALLAFERLQGRLCEIRHMEAGYLNFDETGKINNENQLNQVRLLQEGGTDPGSFAARRARRIKEENSWRPTGLQLERMITLAKGNSSARNRPW